MAKAAGYEFQTPRGNSLHFDRYMYFGYIRSNWHVSNPSREFTSLRPNIYDRHQPLYLYVSNPSREFTSLRHDTPPRLRLRSPKFQTPRGNSLHFDEAFYRFVLANFDEFQTPRGNSLHFDNLQTTSDEVGWGKFQTPRGNSLHFD